MRANIVDFDKTLTIKHTYKEYNLDGAMDKDQYELGKRVGQSNLKEGVRKILQHDEHHLSAVATFHNNPQFVAGHISKLFGGKLTCINSIVKIIGVSNAEKIKIALNVYEIDGIKNPFLIAYIPHQGQVFNAAIRLLRNKNMQIEMIRDYWLANHLITATESIDYYEDTADNYYAAKELGYINGWLVKEGEQHVLINNYRAKLAQTAKANALSLANLGMDVLNCFIDALGASAIAIGVTLLMSSPFDARGLALIGLGMTVVALSEYGLFASNNSKQIAANTTRSVVSTSTV